MTVTVKLDLPESLKSRIDDQISRGNYENLESYIERLILEDQLRQAEHELEEKLLAGLNSGEAEIVDDAFWKKMKADAIERNRGI